MPLGCCRGGERGSSQGAEEGRIPVKRGEGEKVPFPPSQKGEKARFPAVYRLNERDCSSSCINEKTAKRKGKKRLVKGEKKGPVFFSFSKEEEVRMRRIEKGRVGWEASFESRLPNSQKNQ